MRRAASALAALALVGGGCGAAAKHEPTETESVQITVTTTADAATCAIYRDELRKAIEANGREGDPDAIRELIRDACPG